MKIFLLATIAAFSVTAANAQPGRGGEPPNPDTSGDGKVTLAEFTAAQAARQGRMFARLDADKDGKITGAEASAMPHRPEGAGPGGGGAGGLMRLDANKDGSVTEAEMSAMNPRRFEMADANKDGWLSKEEMPMMRQRMRGGPGPQ